MALAVAMLSLLKQCESNFNDKTKRHIPNQYVAITMTAIIVDTVHMETKIHKYVAHISEISWCAIMLNLLTCSFQL